MTTWICVGFAVVSFCVGFLVGGCIAIEDEDKRFTEAKETVRRQAETIRSQSLIIASLGNLTQKDEDDLK